MKKGIALNAFGGTNWIGGIYYIKNVAFQLAQNDIIREKYNIFVFTNKDLRYCFADLPKSITILEVPRGRFSVLLRYFFVWEKNIRYIFPQIRDVKFLRLKAIEWIPDFQDNYYPNLFSEEELERRRASNENTALSSHPLILSSNACLDDFYRFYASDNKKIYVMRFVSYISQILSEISIEYETKIIEKYELSHKHYACVMNQFWQHKNHKVVFDAMQHIVDSYQNVDITIVMTGLMEDHRNPQYIEELKKVIERPSMASHIQILGMVERKEQLVIMKNAKFVIQPSLFEGWGTVLEDAKVLDKTVLLSDIPVHREQMSEKCILFDPHDPKKLAELIIEEFAKSHHDDVEKGIEDMKKRAVEYSKSFERMLEDMENHR